MCRKGLIEWLCQECSTAHGGGGAGDGRRIGVCDVCGNETVVAPVHEYGTVRLDLEDYDA